MSFKSHYKLAETVGFRGREGRRRSIGNICMSLTALFLFVIPENISFAQAPKGLATPPVYFTNEVAVGGVFARARSGSNLDDTNFGGWSISSAHYFSAKWATTVEVQGLYGHAPVGPIAASVSNPLTSKYLYLAGPQWKWRPGRGRTSSSLRLLVGATTNNTQTSEGFVDPTIFGLYSNVTKLALKPSGAFDFNLSPRMAIRYSGGVLLERQNGDFQRDLDMSVGLVFRFGAKNSFQ